VVTLSGDTETTSSQRLDSIADQSPVKLKDPHILLSHLGSLGFADSVLELLTMRKRVNMLNPFSKSPTNLIKKVIGANYNYMPSCPNPIYNYCSSTEHTSPPLVKITVLRR
jgi:hypothetical protein